MNKFLIFIFLLFSANSIKGAFIPALDSEIHWSTYIFEARKISEKTFQPNIGGKSYTSIVYEISKVFKGNLKCGRVEMVIDSKYLTDPDFIVSGRLPISDIGIVLADSSSFPSLVHLKVNSVRLSVREMIEYNHEGTKVSYDYFIYHYFPNRLAIFDTLVRIIGHSYISCNDSTSQFNALPGNEMNQQIPVPFNKVAEQSPYIFEGQFIFSNSFGNPDYPGKIYTSEVYNVKKVFKGNLQCGYVEIVSPEGKTGTSKGGISTHSLKSDSGIIVAKTTSNPSLRNFSTNPTVLEYNTMVEYSHRDSADYTESDFVNRKSLYDILAKITGLEYMSCQNYPRAEPCPEEKKTPMIKDSTIHASVKAPLKVASINVYPNPTQGFINIEIPDFIKFGYLYIYDDSGNLVFQKPIPLHMDMCNFDISILKKGHYIGTIEQGSNKTVNFEFIKE